MSESAFRNLMRNLFGRPRAGAEEPTVLSDHAPPRVPAIDTRLLLGYWQAALTTVDFRKLREEAKKAPKPVIPLDEIAGCGADADAAENIDGQIETHPVHVVIAAFALHRSGKPGRLYDILMAIPATSLAGQGITARDVPMFNPDYLAGRPGGRFKIGTQEDAASCLKARLERLVADGAASDAFAWPDLCGAAIGTLIDLLGCSSAEALSARIAELYGKPASSFWRALSIWHRHRLRPPPSTLFTGPCSANTISSAPRSPFSTVSPLRQKNAAMALRKAEPSSPATSTVMPAANARAIRSTTRNGVRCGRASP